MKWAMLALPVLAAALWLLPSKDSSAPARYRCPMHPDYVSATPGNCPVCGMALVSLAPAPSASTTPPERVPVEIRPDQQRTLGITLAEAKTVSMGRTIHATGRVSMPPASHLLATEQGTVEEVFRYPGPAGALHLKTGDPILSLTSTQASLTVRALGPLILLSTVPVGAGVAQGRDLGLYVDLSRLYVLAEVQSPDIPLVAPGTVATVTLPAHPGKTWRGRMIDSESQFDERAQTLKVKFEFPNGEPDLWTGMLAYLAIESRPARLLAVPESAVLPDGDGEVVFVGRSPTLFEPHRVETGLRANSMVEIKRGLSPGDRVAASAAFLLDSESRLKAMVRTGNIR